MAVFVDEDVMHRSQVGLYGLFQGGSERMIQCHVREV